MTEEQRRELIQLYLEFEERLFDDEKTVIETLRLFAMPDEELLEHLKQESNYDANTSCERDGVRPTREYFAADTDGDCAPHSQLIAKIMEIEKGKQ